MNLKHTPWPWRKIFTSDKSRAIRDVGGIICIIKKPSRYTGQDERYNEELHEAEADQNLIAAAPLMLECLIDLYTIEFKNNKDKIFSAHAIKVLIEKATGQKIEDILK